MEQKTAQIIEILEKQHPNAKCELNYKSPYELLIAVILSAQCTDKRVNVVTKELFKEYDTPEKMLTLTVGELTDKIRTCGLCNSKAKGILEATKSIMDNFGGNVPQTIKELTSLKSVGRKTANVVASTCFDVPAIAVDTHVFRVANRIGLCDEKTPEKTEIALMNGIDESLWTRTHHLLIFQGRYVCKAQRPACGECNLKMLCRYYKDKNEKK